MIKFKLNDVVNLIKSIKFEIEIDNDNIDKYDNPDIKKLDVINLLTGIFIALPTSYIFFIFILVPSNIHYGVGLFFILGSFFYSIYRLYFSDDSFSDLEFKGIRDLLESFMEGKLKRYDFGSRFLVYSVLGVPLMGVIFLVIGIINKVLL